MRKYIIDLTNHLIRKNHYDEWCDAGLLPGHFIKQVKMDLYTGDVKEMNSRKLGEIIGSLEFGDVLASNAELHSELRYHGDMEEFLRELVAFSLACVIRDRIFPAIHQSESIPPYKPRKKRLATGSNPDVVDRIQDWVDGALDQSGVF
jgi:hypothetical protein